MKKEIRLRLTRGRDTWSSYNGYDFLCDRELKEYFKIPKAVRAITLVVSDEPMAQCYEVKGEITTYTSIFGGRKSYVGGLRFRIPGTRGWWRPTIYNSLKTLYERLAGVTNKQSLYGRIEY